MEKMDKLKILKLKRLVEQLECRYDPENDVIPGAPVVTSTDAALLEMIGSLVAMVEDLQGKVERLEKLEIK